MVYLEHTPLHKKEWKKTKNKPMETTILSAGAAAAAAVGVEDEQRFNFGRAAIRPKFSRKRPQLQQKKS